MPQLMHVIVYHVLTFILPKEADRVVGRNNADVVNYLGLSRRKRFEHRFIAPLAVLRSIPRTYSQEIHSVWLQAGHAYPFLMIGLGHCMPGAL
eukprot:753501-Hanusia_phi.AAC.1